MAYKRSKELALKYRGQPCVVCSRAGVGDHILNFKRIPSRDAEWNMWTLCWDCHFEKTNYARGLAEFVKKYRLEKHLLNRGFYYIKDDNKWWHEKA